MPEIVKGFVLRELLGAPVKKKKTHPVFCLLHHLFKRYGKFNESVEFAYWWSSILKGLHNRHINNVYSTVYITVLYTVCNLKY